VDDGSGNATRDVIHGFAGDGVAHIWQPNSGGPAGPRNTGWSAARGEWIAFLDDDDLWHPRKLEACSDALRRLTKADILYHPLETFAEDDPNGRRASRVVGGREFPEDAHRFLLETGFVPLPSSLLIRRTVLQSLGGFDVEPDLAAAEDLDFAIRASAAGYQFAFVPETLARYRVSGTHLSSAKRTVRFAPVLRRRYFAERSLAACPDWLVRWLLSSNLRQLRLSELGRLLAEIRSTESVIETARRVVRCYLPQRMRGHLGCGLPKVATSAPRQDGTRVA
jgi:glycosyltransferase involved in cell wall biosynthesis